MKTKANKYWFAVALIIIANIFIFRVLAGHFSNFIDSTIASHEGRTDPELNPQIQNQEILSGTSIDAPTSE